MNQRFMRAITFFVGISLLLTNLGLVGTIPVMAMANSSPAAPERTQQQEPSDTPPVPAVEPSSTPQPVDTAVVEPVATTEVPVVIPNAAIASPADVATLPDVKICTFPGVINQDQCSILVALYESAGGSGSSSGLGWNNYNNWEITTDYCHWYGVYCASSDGFVTELNLSGNNLKGYLPDNLGDLCLYWAQIVSESDC